MTTTASIAELQSAGLKLEAFEAVAIAQQLIHVLRSGGVPEDLRPPYGPPTAATVVLNADGTVSCAGCGSTPAISEIAIFLDALLPSGSPRVPGALRYAIARALLEVDVPPFDSLDAFSAALARHECGDRAEVIKRLLQRAEPACALAVVTLADRRRPRASATDLRRALREADARLYAQRVAAPPAPPAMVHEHRAGRVRTVPAVAACLGAGMMLIATGEVMQRSDTGPAPAVAAPVVAPKPVHMLGPAPGALTQDVAPVPHAGDSDTQSVPGTVTMLGSGDSRATTSRSSGMAQPDQPAKTTPRDRASRVAPAKAVRPAVKKARAERTGVLDRLKLRWLRKKVVIRADAL